MSTEVPSEAPFLKVPGILRLIAEFLSPHQNSVLSQVYKPAARTAEPLLDWERLLELVDDPSILLNVPKEEKSDMPIDAALVEEVFKRLPEAPSPHSPKEALSDFLSSFPPHPKHAVAAMLVRHDCSYFENALSIMVEGQGRLDFLDCVLKDLHDEKKIYAEYKKKSAVAVSDISDQLTHYYGDASPEALNKLLYSFSYYGKKIYIVHRERLASKFVIMRPNRIPPQGPMDKYIQEHLRAFSPYARRAVAAEFLRWEPGPRHTAPYLKWTKWTNAEKLYLLDSILKTNQDWLCYGVRPPTFSNLYHTFLEFLSECPYLKESDEFHDFEARARASFLNNRNVQRVSKLNQTIGYKEAQSFLRLRANPESFGLRASRTSDIAARLLVDLENYKPELRSFWRFDAISSVIFGTREADIPISFPWPGTDPMRALRAELRQAQQHKVATETSIGDEEKHPYVEPSEQTPTGLESVLPLDHGEEPSTDAQTVAQNTTSTSTVSAAAANSLNNLLSEVRRSSDDLRTSLLANNASLSR